MGSLESGRARRIGDGLCVVVIGKTVEAEEVDGGVNLDDVRFAYGGCMIMIVQGHKPPWESG
jgi:hypothetical protein